MDVYELINSKRGEIHALAKRFGAKNIRIIGSVARYEAHDKSDIDLLSSSNQLSLSSPMQHSSGNSHIFSVVRLTLYLYMD